MSLNSSSALRGVAYSLVQFVVSWIAFFAVLYFNKTLPDYIFFIMFAVWLLAIPFYFIVKNDCNAIFLLFAFIFNLIFFIVTYFLITIFIDYLPHSRGWNRLAYLYPFFGIPLIGLIAIGMDSLHYLCKWIWKLLGNRKSI